MKCKIIIFSPTGGTEKAAKILGAEFSSETQIVDLTDTKFDGEIYYFD